MVESQSPRLRAQSVGSEAELYYPTAVEKHMCFNRRHVKVYETSDPVRFHRQGRRKPRERDFQAE